MDRERSRRYGARAVDRHRRRHGESIMLLKVLAQCAMNFMCRMVPVAMLSIAVYFAVYLAQRA
jgi:tRNA G26 N,N-dimethylase Trm1